MKALLNTIQLWQEIHPEVQSESVYFWALPIVEKLPVVEKTLPPKFSTTQSVVCKKFLVPLGLLYMNSFFQLFFSQKLIQKTLRVVENLGGRVFSTTGSFSTIGSAQK